MDPRRHENTKNETTKKKAHLFFVFSRFVVSWLPAGVRIAGQQQILIAAVAVDSYRTVRVDRGAGVPKAAMSA